MNKKALNTLLVGAVAATTFGLSTQANAMGASKDKEKCYGVVKAGKNACGSADGAHSCAAQATVDGSGLEWIALPKGVCEKLVGGSLEPFENEAKAEDAATEEDADHGDHEDHEHDH